MGANTSMGAHRIPNLGLFRGGHPANEDEHTVTNDSGKPIRVYYHKEKMQTGCDMDAEKYMHMEIAAGLSVTFDEEDIKYATVCVVSDEDEKVIAENYQIQKGQSYIVTADNTIEVQM